MGLSSKKQTKKEIPEWERKAAQDALAKATGAAELGNIGYYGPDVAAMTPQQIAGQQNTLDMASAFGMNVPQGGAMAGMPQAQTFAGGVQGYSSGDMYDQSLQELKNRNPAQAAAYEKLYPNAFSSLGSQASAAELNRPESYLGPQYSQNEAIAMAGNRQPQGKMSGSRFLDPKNTKRNKGILGRFSGMGY
jgi:hypothetical protein